MSLASWGALAVANSVGFTGFEFSFWNSSFRVQPFLLHITLSPLYNYLLLLDCLLSTALPSLYYSSVSTTRASENSSFLQLYLNYKALFFVQLFLLSTTLSTLSTLHSHHLLLTLRILSIDHHIILGQKAHFEPLKFGRFLAIAYQGIHFSDFLSLSTSSPYNRVYILGTSSLLSFHLQPEVIVAAPNCSPIKIIYLPSWAITSTSHWQGQTSVCCPLRFQTS